VEIALGGTYFGVGFAHDVASAVENSSYASRVHFRCSRGLLQNTQPQLPESTHRHILHQFQNQRDTAHPPT
jgi:hypothetical protein